MRKHNRRFSPLTKAFSTKYENHAHMVALYAVWYNFVRVYVAPGVPRHGGRDLGSAVEHGGFGGLGWGGGRQACREARDLQEARRRAPEAISDWQRADRVEIGVTNR